MTARLAAAGSPAANDAARWMNALGIETREDTRAFLAEMVIRQASIPKLSREDVRMLLDPTRWGGEDRDERR
jgi:hypothetical protein